MPQGKETVFHGLTMFIFEIWAPKNSSVLIFQVWNSITVWEDKLVNMFSLFKWKKKKKRKKPDVKWAASILLESVCTFYVSSHWEDLIIEKHYRKKIACAHFGRVERQVNDLVVNGQGKLGFSAAWRLSEGRRVERWARGASFPWHLYSSKWLRSDRGVPCLAHCSFP